MLTYYSYDYNIIPWQYPWLNYDPTETHLCPIPNWCGISLLALKMFVVLLGSLQDLSKKIDTEQVSTSRRDVNNVETVLG